jgi:phosphoserine phosphatase RsbU/P
MHALLDFARRKPHPGQLIEAPVPELHDAQLAAAYYDRRVGGDCYDFLRVGPTRVVFALLDIAGSFTDNGPVISAARGAFRQSAAALFAREDVNEADAMVELCLELNRTILEAAGRVCSSPTFAGCYNEGLGTVSYLNAGHTPGLLRDGDRILELPATGLPLGLFTHAPPDASIVALEPGDALVIVSRGIVEARRRRQEFGLEQVKGSLQRAGLKAAPAICSAILGQVREFTGKSSAQNDVTVVALTRNSAAQAAAAS